MQYRTIGDALVIEFWVRKEEQMNKKFEFEETLASGLKYTEETGRTARSLPIRECSLWQAGVDEPISDLTILSFRQRFGAVAIPAEGIAGVETQPAFRRQGHVRALLTRAIQGISSRVPVVFLSGIDFLYEKFGFVNCLAESHLSLRVRDVERETNHIPTSSAQGVRKFSADDLPAMISLYNQVHMHRPWTHERHAGWNRLNDTQTWHPPSTGIILEREDRIAGYAIFEEPQFGHGPHSLVIDELTAKDTAAAQALLIDIAARSWEMRFSKFLVREPLDSAVGRTAQRLGCTQNKFFPPGGGMMGAILDRQQLLQMLEPELKRRLGHSELNASHQATFDALYSGNIIPDNRILLRLLTGHWSTSDASAFGINLPEQYAQVLDAWFPGGGTRLLPQPYSHHLDHY